MLYLSTRGDPARKHFCEILLEGLAPDGGLSAMALRRAGVPAEDV